MNEQLDRLYQLLPVIYRQRDAEQGWPLRALLRVIAEQVNLVEADISQLYENWFIETCQDWAVPYIGDLIGYTPVHDEGEPGASNTAQENKILIPRREVANTIRYRRRKGTLALLELLAHDTAGWPARAVEFYKQVVVAQGLNHLHLNRGRTVDLRKLDALDRIESAFNEFAHVADMRKISSTRGAGRYNLPNVGLFVWRLKSYSVTKAPAYCIDRVRHHYTFSILGNDAPLFTKTREEPDPTHIAEEINVPVPIRRRAFTEHLKDYYGELKSLYIWRDDLNHPIPHANIVPADLSDWAYRPQEDQVAVDPVLGRIAFPPRNQPRTGVWVTYHYGFPADIGGGEYQRPLQPAHGRTVYRVGAKGDYERINDALNKWREEGPDNALIEITDSGAYTEQLQISLKAGQKLELRAANGTRPVIRLLDIYANRPDAMLIEGPPLHPEPNPPEPPKERGRARGRERAAYPQLPPAQTRTSTAPQCEGQMTLDGLLITGRSVQVSGRLDAVIIRHCTLVPGWSLDHECRPENEEEPSLELINTTAHTVIEHSILGSITVNQSETEDEPLEISLSDSILDATNPALNALSGEEEWQRAYAVLSIRRCTVIGVVKTHAIELAENSIFDGWVTVARRQWGCMRFCYVSLDSRTPRRYHCQPELARQAVQEEYNQGQFSAEERDRRLERETLRVQPEFNSLRYGRPTYCQLRDSCPPEISQGAGDEAEMGVYHDLFQPQREANLRTRLNEYSPAGMDAGIIFVN